MVDWVEEIGGYAHDLGEHGVEGWHSSGVLVFAYSGFVGID